MMSVNIRCLSDWYVREVLILLDQSTKDVKVAYISLSCYYSFCSFRVARIHPVRTGSTSLSDYKKKNVGVYICLFAVRGLPQPLQVNRQRNTHVEVYYTP